MRQQHHRRYRTAKTAKVEVLEYTRKEREKEILALSLLCSSQSIIEHEEENLLSVQVCTAKSEGKWGRRRR